MAFAKGRRLWGMGARANWRAEQNRDWRHSRAYDCEGDPQRGLARRLERHVQVVQSVKTKKGPTPEFGTLTPVPGSMREVLITKRSVLALATFITRWKWSSSITGLRALVKNGDWNDRQFDTSTKL